jgi:signal transduction histidine kinase
LLGVFAVDYGREFGGFFLSLLGQRPLGIPEPPVLFGISFLTTLVLTAYLVTRIKIRIVERGKKIEFELNKYKTLDKAKSNFILQVTHELRGPLAAIKGYHEMMLKGITGAIEEKTGDTLKKATRRTKNLLTIIDEMIDYAYMKSEDEMTFSKVEIDIRDILSSNLEYYEHMALERNINLVSSCQKNIKVYANRDLLNIIISNLITNALRYSDAGSQVAINGDEDGDEVHLLIRDEGMGIEEEELENIFEEFYRTRQAREIEKDGTGLGLSIVKKAVDSLGGRLSVYSEVGKGTSFHIYLPKT